MNRIVHINILWLALPLFVAGCRTSSAVAGKGAKAVALCSVKDRFKAGEQWYDDRGEVINAHGSGVLYANKKYYRYGEERGRRASGGVTLYFSTDLHRCTFESLALAPPAGSAGDIAKGCLTERPKIIFNKKTGKYVMWLYLELKGKGYNAVASRPLNNPVRCAVVKIPAGFYAPFPQILPMGNRQPVGGQAGKAGTAFNKEAQYDAIENGIR